MQKLLYAVVALVGLLIIIGLALPRTDLVEVSTEIDAHPATVFALLNDFRRHALWSTLLETDPDTRISYSDSARGVGATMSWNGAIAGSGAQTIIESEPYTTVGLLLNPGEPGETRSRFELTRGTGTTRVVQRFETDYGMNLVGRYFAGMLGSVIARDLARSLANLRELAESLPRADFSDLEIEHVDVESSEIAYLAVTARREPAALAEAMRDAYFQVLNFIDAQELSVAGAPLTIMATFSGATRQFDAAIPVTGITESTPRNGPTVRLRNMAAGPAIRVAHRGSYRTLATTHRKIAAYLAAYGIERDGSAFESYVSDPARAAEEDLLTYVYYPIKPSPAPRR
ncbi:MAG: hypothetical protein HKN64_00710 [Woeseiaceae bacterium]|nr:hypothetical protein [Woeseiaceae bacterium]